MPGRSAEPEGAAPVPGLRVLVVDDSPHNRRTLKSLLQTAPEVASVETAANGRLALEEAVRRPRDLVLLDLEMPVMDGFTFLRLFRTRSETPVLVVSSRTDPASAARALDLGACDFIAKPGNSYEALRTIERELRLKVRKIAARTLGRPQLHPESPPESPSEVEAFPVVAIGASSGGPPSLQNLLSNLPRHPAAAVLIAQHMPPGFTGGLAKRLGGILRVPVREARDGDPVACGAVLIAPGGRNLAVHRAEPGAPARVVLEQPTADFAAPSVDRLLETAAVAFGARLTAIILTGMGRDGAAGVRAVRCRGGRTIAESEETAAIFGMPREAAATGCVDDILPLPEIAARIDRLCARVTEASTAAGDSPEESAGAQSCPRPLV